MDTFAREEIDMRILIGADIVPTLSNQQYFEEGQMEKIVDSRLFELLKKADYRVFNLEVPMTDKSMPIEKAGPNLIASVKSVAGLKQLGINFFTLANNHILDQGEQGLWSTMEQLDKNKISYAGVGHTYAEAAKPHIVEMEGKKIGIYCCAEHEFSIVSAKQAGANPFDPLESLDHIVALRAQCDYVICLYHGGKEHYRYPSPNLQKTCRKIVEKGADLVICQHTHCIGCEEKWQEGTIVYGQGNFLFDHSESEFWQTSVLVSVDTNTKKIEYIPLRKNGKGVRLAIEDDATKILTEMMQRSEEIKKEDFIEKQYRAFALQIRELYLKTGDPIATSFVFRVLNKLLRHKLMPWYLERKLKKNRQFLINFVECEAHREVYMNGIKN